MALVFFELASPDPLHMHIGLEPIHNILNSVALLNSAENLPALDSWVHRTAAALTPVERHTNRLIFTGLSLALLSHAQAHDFETYLDALTTQHPEALRNQVLEQLRVARPESDAAGPLSADRLLADAGAYIAQVARVSNGAAIDAALHAEVHALLNEPFRMHDLIVTHLRAIWERWLAAEWARIQRSLENQVRLLQHSVPNSGITPEIIAEKLQAFIARPNGAAGADQLIFVPSAHTNRYTTELRFGATRWLFFDAQLNFSVLLRDSPVGEPELVGRLSALTEPMRLRVLELLAASDELTMQDIMEQLDISQPNASRYLKSLSVYVAERRAKDGKKHYRLIPAQLDLTFQALKQRVLNAGTQVVQQPVNEELRPEGVARWLNAQGILAAWPGRERDRLTVLEHLASFFEVGSMYTEQEVNAIITARVFPYVRDHVTIRRDLVDFQFLRRVADGSRYWRNTEPAAQPPQHSSEPGT